MKIEEVANRLVERCRNLEFLEAAQELYADNITSYEPKGSKGEEITKGKVAVLEKTRRFMNEAEEMSNVMVSEPEIADNFFSVSMKLMVRMPGMPAAMPMDEICVYHVLDGKIVNEHFFHTVQ